MAFGWVDIGSDHHHMLTSIQLFNLIIALGIHWCELRRLLRGEVPESRCTLLHCYG